MTCHDSYHDAIAAAPRGVWRASVRDIEHVAVLGTDYATERGVCSHCSATVVRGRVKLADVIVRRRPRAATSPTHWDDDTAVSEWSRPEPTLPGMPRPPMPGINQGV